MTGLELQWRSAFKIYVHYLLLQFYNYYGNTNTIFTYKVNSMSKFLLEIF